MKTKDLIKELQETDPSGELECCVNNADISFIDLQQAYWDGALQVLTRDNQGRIIGAKYTDKGQKVVIYPLSIPDAILNVDDLPIEYETTHHNDFYREHIVKRREFVRKLCNKVECDQFCEYVAKRIITEARDFDEKDAEKLKKAAKEFYDKNLYYKDPMPKDIQETHEQFTDPKSGETYNSYPSWFSLRCKQWDREIVIEPQGDTIKLKKKGNGNG